MTYVTSDLHGFSLEKFQKLLDKVGFSENDFCIILGDVIDRGVDGIKILQWLLVQPNVELILGNHEAMLLKCRFLFDEITDESLASLGGEDLSAFLHWQRNGAKPTLEALQRTDAQTRLDILEYLEESPLYELVSVNGRDFLLVHGGLRDFAPNKKLRDYCEEDFLWTRPDPEDRYFDDVMTVIGHTPTQYYGYEYKGRAMKTDTWIDIDTGAGSGGSPMLLRLDDLQEFYLDDDTSK